MGVRGCCCGCCGKLIGKAVSAWFDSGKLDDGIVAVGCDGLVATAATALATVGNPIDVALAAPPVVVPVIGNSASGSVACSNEDAVDVLVTCCK